MLYFKKIKPINKINKKNIMFNSSKFLFKDLKFLFGYKNYNSLFKKTINNSKKIIKDTLYKINNLFEVNLENGLTNFYLKNFYDAKLRFFIMNFFWKKSACINYNLGRVYFYLNKQKESLKYLKNSIIYHNENKNDINCKKFFKNKLAIFYKKKITLDENIFYIPYQINKEKYDHMIDNSILYSFQRLEDLRSLSSIFNHYIWIYKNLNNSFKDKINILDIGSGLGELGELLREEHKSDIIDGIEISEKQSEFLNQYEKDLTEELKRKNNENSDIKIYNQVNNNEMHDFLINNFKLFHDINEAKNEDSDLENEKILEKSNYLYDVIFSMGTFGEFGQIGTILHLCELNLKQNGLLIFYLFQSEDNKLKFNILDDYFYYNIEYIEKAIIQNTNFTVEFIDNKIKINNKNIIFIILKKQ
jgi:cyclopropane fatty-acyl-phospholipid synthase-like methyltransferase